MPARRRNYFAIWADRLRPRSYRGVGKVQGQERLADVVSVARSCGIWVCEAKHFKLFADQ